MAKTTVSLSLSEKLLDKLDLERKLVSRSVYVEFLLNKLLEKENEREQ